MGKITNITGISLPLAVWLASDNYDFSPDHRSISATSLLKPIRQILLKERLTEEHRETPDVSEFIASRLGHSIHDGIESAWTRGYAKAMKSLGYSENVISRVRINPTDEELRESNDLIPVYLEQRGSRDFGPYRISGKFDMVVDGELTDFKSTSVYTYLLGSKDEDYCLQGSIYKWIHRDKITSDFIAINFIFTDWQRARARQSNDYPQQRVMEHRVKLMSIQETEAWIANRIRTLEANANKSESELPHCSDADLWRGETTWKFYSNPQKTSGRSTKNFSDKAEAYAHAAAAGKGIVIEEPGKVKACGYCPAAPLCTQKDMYEHA